MSDEAGGLTVNLDSSVYYGTHYWNDHDAVRRELNRRATGDEDVIWYRHLLSLQREPFRKALILNCGNGWVERELLAHGVVTEAVGVDVSEALLADARAAAATEGLPLRYYEMDTNAAAFPEDGYDLVVNHAAMHHVAYVDRVIRAVARLLPADGVFVSYDYVGADRNQYPADQWDAIWAANLRLPEHLRARLSYPHLPTMLASDPTEAIHAQLTLPVTDRYFRRVHSQLLGGGLAYNLLTFNEAFFAAPADEAARWLTWVLERDAHYLAARPDHSQFAYVVAVPDPARWPDEPTLAAWAQEEDEREASAAAHGGRYGAPSMVQSLTEELVALRDANTHLRARVDELEAAAAAPAIAAPPVGEPVDSSPAPGFLERSARLLRAGARRLRAPR